MADTQLLDQLLGAGPWIWREDYGSYLMHDLRLADAVGWECHSCNADKMWVKWADAEADVVPAWQVMLIRVECGWCREVQVYDKHGEELR